MISTRFGLGFFEISNSSRKTTTSVKISCLKGQARGQLWGRKNVESATPQKIPIVSNWIDRIDGMTQ